MADEIKVTISASLENGELKDRVQQKRVQNDQATAEMFTTVMTEMSTLVVHVGFDDSDAISAAGAMFLENLSTKYAVHYGLMSNSTLIDAFTLPPSNIHHLSWNIAWGSTDIGFRANASTDAPSMKFKVYSQ